MVYKPWEGGLQAVGGSTLVGGGLAACVETFGAGCVVAAIGGFQMLSGWDNVETGMETVLDAKTHTTMRGEFLQKQDFLPEVLN